MKTLKPQMEHPQVEKLKETLQELKYPNIKIDMRFDHNTIIATMLFQITNGLLPDGVVGNKTWQVLELKEKLIPFPLFQKAASDLECELATLLAVSKVESPGSGFLSDGRPKILFEGHVFYDRLSEYDINPEPLQKEYPSIIYPNWDKSKYKGSGDGKTSGIDDEYERLDIARSIHEEAALESASWGKYQIMGFNYFKCGYEELSDFIYDCQLSEVNHLNMFLKFIEFNGLTTSLRDKKWNNFARIYNGKGYKSNQYDLRLKLAFDQIKGMLKTIA